MKKIIQFLTPSFLNKIDQNLLEKYPFLWSKRFAHVMFFGLLILTIHTLVTTFYPISIFNYTPLWVFVWIFTVPTVLFVLIWLFFQYKYDLAWDYARMKWTYYLGTGLIYIFVLTFGLLMVLLPVGIYQHRVNTYYLNSVSVDLQDFDHYQNGLSYKYLSYHSYEEKEKYVTNFIDKLDYISPSFSIDTIIKPGIETIYNPYPILTLFQPGDDTKKYEQDHYWIVKLNKNKKDTSHSGYFEGTINMFCPRLFFNKNTDLVYKNFDSTTYYSQSFFDSDFLHTTNMPEPKDTNEINWSLILLDNRYYVDSQSVRVYDKKEISKIIDHRLNKSYSKFIFITDLPEQNQKFEHYYIGVNHRGKQLLIEPSDFYELKRLEYFLFTKLKIESLDHITPAFVNKHAEELQQLGDVIEQIERDYGNDFVYYNDGKLLVYLIIIYIVTAILALILLTIRLLNFRLLVISLLSLFIFCFILFVPLIASRVKLFNVVPLICLSVIAGYFIYFVIRIFYAKGTTLYMRLSALAGLVVLPLIALFYFTLYIKSNYDQYHEEQIAIIILGYILTVIFLFGHIPLIAAIIHRLFYLPKK